MSASLLGADAQKRLATLRARAALAGVTLINSRDEHGRPEWIATRWHLTRSLSSLDEIEQWLDRVGAPR